MKSQLIFFAILLSSVAQAHILIDRVSRQTLNNATNDDIKFTQPNKANPVLPDNPGPCGGAAYNTRMPNPLQFTVGQTIAIEVNETINHPGRFIVQFSPANDTGYWAPQNQLAVIEDLQNRARTPVNITLPNTPCTNCTLRVLQEMDDQPGEFYVHCVDIILNQVAATPPISPAPPDVSVLSTANEKSLGTASFGGCSLFSSSNKSKSASMPWWMSLVFLPVIFTFVFLSNKGDK